MKTTRTLIGQIKNIDFKRLSYQKGILLRMIEDWGKSGDSKKIQDSAEAVGIVNLISTIQDHAVDELGFDSKEVFGFKDEAKHLREMPFIVNHDYADKSCTNFVTCNKDITGEWIGGRNISAKDRRMLKNIAQQLDTEFKLNRCDEFIQILPFKYFTNIKL